MYFRHQDTRYTVCPARAIKRVEGIRRALAHGTTRIPGKKIQIPRVRRPPGPIDGQQPGRRLAADRARGAGAGQRAAGGRRQLLPRVLAAGRVHRRPTVCGEGQRQFTVTPPKASGKAPPQTPRPPGRPVRPLPQEDRRGQCDGTPGGGATRPEHTVLRGQFGVPFPNLRRQIPNLVKKNS